MLLGGSLAIRPLYSFVRIPIPSTFALNFFSHQELLILGWGLVFRKQSRKSRRMKVEPSSTGWWTYRSEITERRSHLVTVPGHGLLVTRLTVLG